MQHIHIKVRMLVLLLSTTAVMHAQQSGNIITTAVPFLRISPDAGAGGMADIGIATTPTASSAFWNVGKLPFSKEQGSISASYTPWLKDLAEDMYLASVSGYYRWSENQAFHGSFRYFNMGDLQFADDNGTHLQVFQAREWSAEAGYARKLSAKTGLGITLRFIHSNLGNKGTNGNDYQAGNAVAADIGYYYHGNNAAGSGWSFGAALTNLGSKLSYGKGGDNKDFIPANLGLGTAYTKVINDRNRISFGLDLNKLMVPAAPGNGDPAALSAYHNKSVTGSWFSSFSDASFKDEIKEWQIAAGAEYWYNDQFALRAGYSFEDKNQGNRKYFTAGAGVKYHIATLNFAYLFTTGSTQNPLNNTLRFGVNIDVLK